MIVSDSDDVNWALVNNPEVVKPWLRIIHGFAQMVCTKGEMDRWVFRGEAKNDRALVPTIARRIPQLKEVECRQHERILFERFRRLALMHLSTEDLVLLREAVDQIGEVPGRSLADTREGPGLGPERMWLALMQHYGVPTRYLDWTESPWIALYFACTSSPERNGIVYAMDRLALGKGTPTRDMQPIRIFEDIHRPSPNIVQVVKVPDAFRRLANQLGLFTVADSPLFDHRHLLRQILPAGGFQYFEIHKSWKPVFLRLLRSMNIRHSSVFPGLDGLGETIRREFYQ